MTEENKKEPEMSGLEKGLLLAGGAGLGLTFGGAFEIIKVTSEIARRGYCDPQDLLVAGSTFFGGALLAVGAVYTHKYIYGTEIKQ